MSVYQKSHIRWDLRWDLRSHRATDPMIWPPTCVLPRPQTLGSPGRNMFIIITIGHGHLRMGTPLRVLHGPTQPFTPIIDGSNWHYVVVDRRLTRGSVKERWQQYHVLQRASQITRLTVDPQNLLSLSDLQRAGITIPWLKEVNCGTSEPSVP